MSPEPDSVARLRAVEIGGDPGAVEGPLQGYHHETYVISLPPRAGGVAQGRWKCRAPRSNLLWFDRRCFASEEQLLTALRGHVRQIPEVVDVDGCGLQHFIEGVTLGSMYASGQGIPDDAFRQIVDVFGQLAALDADALAADRKCDTVDRPVDGDTNGFLERLVCFTEERVYAENLKTFESLFRDLGVEPDAFGQLRKTVAGLHERPFCLLHADLHRENFIVDPDRLLWTIDWELAMVGDPLYDLATHLYLMQYPMRQARRMAKQWRTAVEAVRPGSAKGMEEDLDRLIDYKRAQSVFTDVIREALKLGSEPDSHWGQLVHSGLKLRRILMGAAGPLGLDLVPSPAQIMGALTRWCRAREAAGVLRDT
ncbi:phosphotransferase family protein [Streptomyces sp. NPDC059010]|uniref:phosphotransferase family protein n=1 Tax=Streptomyces sp. NPDC059010 TaxID=3346695 RepID=UPI0036A30F38